MRRTACIPLPKCPAISFTVPVLPGGTWARPSRGSGVTRTRPSSISSGDAQTSSLCGTSLARLSVMPETLSFFTDTLYLCVSDEQPTAKNKKINSADRIDMAEIVSCQGRGGKTGDGEGRRGDREIGGTGRQGDKETRRQGDKETRRPGSGSRVISPSLRPSASPSPCLSVPSILRRSHNDLPRPRCGLCCGTCRWRGGGASGGAGVGDVDIEECCVIPPASADEE